jgi:SAM-dependent methyltransferase
MALDQRFFDGKLSSAVVYPEFFPLEASDRVVNLGCGVGPQLVIYRNAFREMACVDLLPERLERLREHAARYGITNFRTLCARVEATGLPPSSFEKAIAVDIIEHLPEPMKLLGEIHRLLVPGGRALVTIPVMHDRFTHALRRMKEITTGRATPLLPEGHPDRHNADLRLREWLRIFAASPLRLVAVRATTLFPPLHLYGVPRFWFTNRAVHAVDKVLCQTPGIRRLGQAWMCILRKP